MKTSKKKKAWIEIHNVLHVPEMSERLLSAKTIRNSGGAIILGKGRGMIKFAEGLEIPLEQCDDSDLECIKIEIKKHKEGVVRERTYKVVTRKVNELWSAVEEDLLDVND